MSELKRRGRPRMVPEDRKGRNLTFRTSAGLRSQIEEAATANGRSASAEVEFRLAASFAEDRMRAIAREEIQAVQDERNAATLKMLKARPDRDLRMLDHLAETAPERTTSSLRKALNDPAVKQAVHQRYNWSGEQ